MFNKFPILRFIGCVVMFLAACVSLNAQTDDEVTQAAARAAVLFQSQRYTEAVPHFEIVVKAMPNEAKVRFMYGFSLLGKSKQTSNTDEARQLAAKALDQFKEAKKLGLKDEMNDSLISILSGESTGNGPGGPAYSSNAEAEKTMNEAETLFAQAKYDEAVKLFEKALTLDPKIYQAAISGGDCFVAKSDWANAEKWYQRAIVIDPTRETAYRYSATPFMKQNKYDIARDRYIEAYIVEPYNRMSSRGINQWADVTGKNLTHPAVEAPEIAFDAAGKASAKTKIDPANPAMSPWLAYVAERESWKNGKFARAYPKTSAYRDSLAEELESLRAAVRSAQEKKSANKQFEILARLDKEGLLESYILLARANEGIAEDHPAYLKDNRQKLKLYVANYVIQK